MSSIHEKDFFWQWFNNPKEVGAIFPSSGSLAKAMAMQVKNTNDGSIIELGAGTGVITTALLQTGVKPKQLQIVEKNPAMAQALRLHFPDLDIIEADVSSHFRSITKQQLNNEINTIVSGLPMLLFDAKQQYSLLKRAFSLMAKSGTFIQFTYGLTPPISKAVMERLGLQSTRVAFVWRNTPPAFVWRLDRVSENTTPQVKTIRGYAHDQKNQRRSRLAS